MHYISRLIRTLPPQEYPKTSLNTSQEKKLFRQLMHKDPVVAALKKAQMTSHIFDAFVVNNVGTALARFLSK